MLRATDVSFAYRGTTDPVLNRVSLTVERATIVGVLGPNGSGKTTLLRVLAGMLRASTGSVVLDGVDIASISRRDLARRVAVVPQETHTTFDFTVLDIVLMGRYPHLGALQLEGPDDLRVARESLAATGTVSFEQRRFNTLSGGEKQRVVIASALAQSADLLLLDEPTASLDLAYQLEIAGLLKRLNRERRTTMIISTHDLNLAAALCDRVVLLTRGRVVADGPIEQCLTIDNVRAVYGVDADIRFHARAGHFTVVPLARST
jgi:iron complex transport system ATP-binding protein